MVFKKIDYFLKFTYFFSLFMISPLQGGLGEVHVPKNTKSFKSSPLSDHVPQIKIQNQMEDGSGSLELSDQKYKIYETQWRSVMIREYVNQEGIVFAIAWNGLIHPPLEDWIGTNHYAFYTEKSSELKKNKKRTLSLQSDQLVLQKWGAMGHLQGRAYDPQLLPVGVNPLEIQ